MSKVSSIFLLLVAMLAPSPARAEGVRLESLEAAFVQKFTNYIEWPAQEGPFLVGVLGDEAMYQAMLAAFGGKTVNGRPAKVLRLERAEKGGRYDILHVGEAVTSAAKEVGNLASNGLLSVSRAKGGLEHGMVVNFYLDGDKLRFEINAEMAARRGLKVNSRLLHLAKAAK